jgi:pyruvate/2-oxoglutarate/acetoin dehydrogenase E1 component
MRELSYRDALNEAIQEEMEQDETVFFVGEDIGPVREPENLWEEFRKRRVWQTPISESGFTGLAVGAAMTGLRPIVDIMFCDFVTVCMDPIANQAAKIYLMSGCQVNVPIVIQMPANAGGERQGAHHCQNLESWFVHTPGLKVVMPSTPYDVKGLMKSSIRDDGPVVFFQGRCPVSQHVPDGEWIVPLGKADVKREGRDITVVATSIALHRTLQVAEELNGEIDVEVVDPRTLLPLDIDTILQSVEKTRRLLVVHDAPTRGGVGAEIVRQVVEKGFEHLSVPPKVLGGLNSPMPYSEPLERLCIPSKDNIAEAIKEFMGRL